MDQTFEELKKEYSKCSKCNELCKSRSQVVFGSGNKDSDVLFIGEAPGANEDKNGIPFCGRSGQVLNILINSINMEREDIFITNTILCRPENNRNPAKAEVEMCRDRLDKLIEIMKPKVIVTIGNFATQRIIGKTGIKSIKGKIFPTKINDKLIRVVPIIHPASYLYSGQNPKMLAEMKEDFQVIAKVVSDYQNPKKQISLTNF